MIVDASVATQWYVPGFASEEAETFLHRGELYAPDLLVAETANAILKYVRAGAIADEDMKAALSDLPQRFAGFIPATQLIERAASIALRLDHPIYDCLYVACAEQRGMPLVTADRRLANKLASVADYADLAIVLGA